MVFRINSRVNVKVKELLKNKNNFCFLEGKKLVLDILNKRTVKVTRLIVQESAENDFSLYFSRVDEVWVVSRNVLKKLSSLKEASEVMAVISVNPQPIAFSEKKIILALDNLQDPGNVGTLFRAALAFGVEAIAFSGFAVNTANEKFLRAAQNSIFDIQYEYFANIEVLIRKAEQNGFQIYLTSAQEQKGKVKTNDVLFPCLIVLGGEGSGIDKKWLASYPVITIAHQPNIESLNVAITGCLIMYDLYNLSNR